MINRAYEEYLKTVSGMVVVSLCLLVLVSFKSLFIDHIFIYQKLYNHQLSKIAGSGDAATVFVGDSSLGNAIDAAQFSDLSATKTLNLALTGVYGYGGAYNMIKKAVKHNPVRNVVVMMQTNTLSAPMTYDGYVYTFEAPYDLGLKEWFETGRTFLNVTLSPYAFMNIAKHYMGLLDPGVIEHDYVRQGPRLALTDRTAPVDGNIVTEQGIFLKKISAFCSRRNINLIYAHGPVIEDALMGASTAVGGLNAFIQEQGIRAVVGPVPIARGDVGDTRDHVYPTAKAKYTQAYFNLLKGFLI